MEARLPPRRKGPRGVAPTPVRTCAVARRRHRAAAVRPVVAPEGPVAAIGQERQPRPPRVVVRARRVRPETVGRRGQRRQEMVIGAATLSQRGLVTVAPLRAVPLVLAL